MSSTTPSAQSTTPFIHTHHWGHSALMPVVQHSRSQNYQDSPHSPPEIYKATSVGTSAAPSGQSRIHRDIPVAIYMMVKYGNAFSRTIILDAATSFLPVIRASTVQRDVEKLEYVIQRLEEAYCLPANSCCFPRFVGSYQISGDGSEFSESPESSESYVRVANVQVSPGTEFNSVNRSLRLSTMFDVMQTGPHRNLLSVLLPYCVCRVQNFHLEFPNLPHEEDAAMSTETAPTDQGNNVNSVALIRINMPVKIESHHGVPAAMVPEATTPEEITKITEITDPTITAAMEKGFESWMSQQSQQPQKTGAELEREADDRYKKIREDREKKE